MKAVEVKPPPIKFLGTDHEWNINFALDMVRGETTDEGKWWIDQLIKLINKT